MSNVLNGFLWVIGFFILAILAAVTGIFWFIARGGQKARLLALSTYVDLRGYRFFNPDLPLLLNEPPFQLARKLMSKELKSPAEGLRDLREFRGDLRAGVAGIALSFQGTEMVVFPHSDRGQGARNRASIPLRVAILRSGPNPEFRLQKRTVAERILELTGVSPHVELPAHPGFNKNYHLSTRDEAGTRSFLTEPKLAWLDSNALSGELVAQSQHLVYLEQGKLTDDASYDAFIESAQAIFEALA